MTGTVPDSIDAVLVQLTSEIGSDLLVGPVATRVTLRTGINVRQPRPDQRHDRDAVATVVAALNDMGYLK